MNLFIFQNPHEVFQFFYVYENTVFEIKSNNRATVSSITRKILLYDMEFRYEILKGAYIYQNFLKILKNVKKIEILIWSLKNQKIRLK